VIRSASPTKELKGREKYMDVEFKRTMRLPEDGQTYDLPAYFGSFPLLDVKYFKNRMPKYMQDKGGHFISLYQRETLSLSFSGKKLGALSTRPASPSRH